MWSLCDPWSTRGRRSHLGTRSPYELYENDEVFVQEMVTAEELAVISGLVPKTDWQPL